MKLMSGALFFAKRSGKKDIMGWLFLILSGLLLPACGGSTEPGPTAVLATPDLVATEVAVQKAAFATLTAEAPTVAASPVDVSTVTPTQTTPPDISPGVTATLATSPTAPADASPTVATGALRCQVTASGLNLRSGPGTVFSPPLTALGNGAELTPRSFIASGFPGGQWLEVQAPGGQIGWVSADPQLVNCNVNFTALPVGTAPPTPIPTPTPTPSPTATSVPTPTPTPLIFAVVPVDGADDNDFLQGRRVILPGLTPQQVTIPPVFRNRISFGIEAYDIRFGTHDGAGIDRVDITLIYNSDEGDIVVHQEVEQEASFCAFGSAGPSCNIWVFAEHNNRWPNGYPILNGSYQVEFDIVPLQGDLTQWRWSFEIEGLDSGTLPGEGTLVAEIVQTGLSSTSTLVTTALVFQVRAYHTGYGATDGDGINRVEFSVFDQQGNEVYQKVEGAPAYCAFGGGEPDCTVLPLDQIESGFYTLQAIAHAQDGQTVMVSQEVEIQGDGY